jgi:hypothetical protein
VSYRRQHGIDVYLGEARFVAPKVLEVGGERLHGQRFVVSAGSRPVIPALPGLEPTGYRTSDSIMRLDELPRSLQAMCLHNTVDEIAGGVLYIHPALTEVVEQALLALDS